MFTDRFAHKVDRFKFSNSFAQKVVFQVVVADADVSYDMLIMDIAFAQKRLFTML